MARGRRKVAKSRVNIDEQNCNNAEKTLNECKKSRGVNGRLSHATPVKSENQRITHYFHPVPSTPAENLNVKNGVSCGGFNGELDVEVIKVVSRTEDQLEKRVTPHRIQYNPQITRSPSSALQHLRLVCSPKKPSKTRRRLNPSQVGNQILKPVRCTQRADNERQLKEFFPVRRSERKTKGTVLQEKQHKMEAAVISGCEEGLEVHNFEGKGRGIVATRLFCKGEFVVEYAGELIDMTEAKSREKMYAQDQNTGCYMYYFRHQNTQYCVDATAESGRLGRLVNHSRNGNLSTKTVEIDKKPRLVLIAKEDISAGEEVTYDYGDRSKESIRYHPWLLS